MELWKDAVGYEQYFSISNTGKVFSKRSNKILKTQIHPSGREIFATRFDGKGSKAKCFKVHRLVAEAFVPNPECKPQVNHIDGNPLNNNSSNLEWATNSENILHSFRIGLHKQKSGLDNPLFKLSQEQVNSLLLLVGQKSYRELGRVFGVHHKTIRRIEKQYA